MAFFSLMLAYGVLALIAVCVLLFAVGITGIVIIVVSLKKRSKAVKDGRKPAKAGLIAGIIITSLPLLAVAVTTAAVTFGIIKTGVESAENIIQEASGTKDPTLFRQEWMKNKMWSDTAARNDAFKGVFEAVDNEDADALINMFSDNRQQISPDELKKEADKLISECPKGFSQFTYHHSGGSSGGSTDEGKRRDEFYSSGYIDDDNGNRYFIYLGGVYRSDNDTSEIGLDSIAVFSAAGEWNFRMEQAGDICTDENEYVPRIKCDVRTDTENRYIILNNNQVWKLTPHDRHLSADEFIKAYDKGKLDEMIGEPDSDHRGYSEMLYVLDDEERKYAVVCYDYYGRYCYYIFFTPDGMYYEEHNDTGESDT